MAQTEVVLVGQAKEGGGPRVGQAGGGLHSAVATGAAHKASVDQGAFGYDQVSGQAAGVQGAAYLGWRRIGLSSQKCILPENDQCNSLD